ncbi:MAG: glycosyltransferase family 2 protein [Gammaproteobacteria bacterium]|nr:glycosyltransferase family 2 protein [Gammaproteobacteria bacterium]
MKQETPLKWLVVIPAYNEEATIEKLIDEVLHKSPTELLIVNDASEDRTAEIINGMKNHLNFQVIHQKKNQGKAASLWQGFDLAIQKKFDVVLTLDGDGQHRAEDLPLLIDAYHKNTKSLVIGARKKDLKTQPLARFLANRFANFWVSWAAGYSVKDSQSGFRLYPVTLLEQIQYIRNTEGFVFESEVIIEAAWRDYYSEVVEIPTIYHKNRRPSHFKPYQDIKKITQMISRKLFSKKMNLKGLKRVLLN